MATNAELLEAARNALTSVLASPFQKHAIMGRVFEQKNANELWSLIQELERAVEAESRGGMRTKLARPV